MCRVVFVVAMVAPVVVVDVEVEVEVEDSLLTRLTKKPADCTVFTTVLLIAGINMWNTRSPLTSSGTSSVLSSFSDTL